MGIERRIENLEKTIGGSGNQQSIVLVLYEGQPKPTEAQRQAAIADYKAKNPSWAEKDITVIYVTSENAKKLTEDILAGKGTER